MDRWRWKRDDSCTVTAQMQRGAMGRMGPLASTASKSSSPLCRAAVLAQQSAAGTLCCRAAPLLSGCASSRCVCRGCGPPLTRAAHRCTACTVHVEKLWQDIAPVVGVRLQRSHLWLVNTWGLPYHNSALSDSSLGRSRQLPRRHEQTVWLFVVAFTCLPACHAP
jgi:hypothetical protein